MQTPASPVFPPPLVAVPATAPAPRWSLRDTWLGFALIVPAVGLAAVGISVVTDPAPRGTLALILSELACSVPVLAIMFWRKLSLRDLGFRPFDSSSIGIGCSTIAVAYAIGALHNILLAALGLSTQGAQVVSLLKEPGVPLGLVISGVGLAPLLEESLFRGFLFQGLRQAYGPNKAILFSSLLFSAFHLQLEALLPTFLLGLALSYTFQRSNSIWPGVLMHFLVNLVGILFFLLAFLFQQYIPA